MFIKVSLEDTELGRFIEDFERLHFVLQATGKSGEYKQEVIGAGRNRKINKQNNDIKVT